EGLLKTEHQKLLKSPDTFQRRLRWTGEKCSQSLPCCLRSSAWSHAPCGRSSAPPWRPSLRQDLPRAAASSHKSTSASPCHSTDCRSSVALVFLAVKFGYTKSGRGYT